MWNHCIGRCGQGLRRAQRQRAQQSDHAGKADQQESQRLGKGQAQLGANEAGAPEQHEKPRSQEQQPRPRFEFFSHLIAETKVATPH
jgi:hypothetical protein